MNKLPLLGSAPVPASPDSNLQLVLISATVVLVVGMLGFFPVRMARLRGHRNREAIMALVIIWGLLSAGSISHSVMRQMDWSATQLQRIQSGYGDPRDTSDKPNAPVGLWCGLGAAYPVLLVWAARRPQTVGPEG